MKRFARLSALVAALICSAAQADDETSKSAGLCWAYKFGQRKDAEGVKALLTASNRQLAKNYGQRWLDDVMEAGKSGNNSRLGSLVGRAQRACVEIGLDAS